MVNNLAGSVVDVVAPLRNRRLHVQLAVLDNDLAVVGVLELVDNADLNDTLVHNLVEALLEHVVRGKLLVRQVVANAVKVAEHKGAQLLVPLLVQLVARLLGLGQKCGIQSIKVGLEGNVTGRLAQLLGNLGLDIANLGVVALADGGLGREGKLGCGALSDRGFVEGLDEVGRADGFGVVGTQTLGVKQDKKLAVLDGGTAVLDRGGAVVNVHSQDMLRGSRVQLVDAIGAVLLGKTCQLEGSRVGIALDELAEVVLGIRRLGIWVEDEGVDVDGPGGAQSLGDALLKLGLLVLPPVADYNLLVHIECLVVKAKTYRSCGEPEAACRQAEGET